MRSLGEREFVGTESRLNTVFELLRQIVRGTEADPAARLAELARRRQEVDDEIERVRAGEIPLLDRSAVRDRYQQLSATAWELLSDFRQVEENFRRLDRQLREKIAGWQGGKGELLDDVLGSRESIAGSDQGRSFQAFYDFLLSQARQEELAGLLDRVDALSGLAERDPGCGGCTTTGWTRPGAPRRSWRSFQNSCAVFSTIRPGSRTGGSSTFCARSRAARCGSAVPRRPGLRPRSTPPRPRSPYRSSARSTRRPQTPPRQPGHPASGQRRGD